MLLLGYGEALGRKAQLLAGHDIDFYQRALQTSVSGQAWSRGSWGWLPGDSAPSRALKEKHLRGGAAVFEGSYDISQHMPSL